MKRVSKLATKRKSRKQKSGSCGQATTEFALVLLLMLLFTFFFVHLAFYLGFSSYVQYATFMSARALMAAGPTESDQLGRARLVMNAYLRVQPKWVTSNEGPVFGADPFYNPSPKGPKKARYEVWAEGVKYTFSTKLFGKSGLGGEKLTTDQVKFSLTSESWLGREPTTEECRKYMQDKAKQKSTGSSAPVNWVVDNGC